MVDCWKASALDQNVTNATSPWFQDSMLALLERKASALDQNVTNATSSWFQDSMLALLERKARP